MVQSVIHSRDQTTIETEERVLNGVRWETALASWENLLRIWTSLCPEVNPEISMPRCLKLCICSRKHSQHYTIFCTSHIKDVLGVVAKLRASVPCAEYFAALDYNEHKKREHREIVFKTISSWREQHTTGAYFLCQKRSTTSESNQEVR